MVATRMYIDFMDIPKITATYSSNNSNPHCFFTRESIELYLYYKVTPKLYKKFNYTRFIAYTQVWYDIKRLTSEYHDNDYVNTKCTPIIGLKGSFNLYEKSLLYDFLSRIVDLDSERYINWLTCLMIRPYSNLQIENYKLLFNTKTCFDIEMYLGSYNIYKY